MPPKKAESVDFHVGSFDSLARFFGVNRITIKEWTHSADFPQKNGDGYSLSRIASWRIAYLNDLVRKGGNRTEADRRLKAAKAEIAELDLAERRQEVYDAETVQRTWRRYFTSAKTVILGITDAVLVLVPQEIRAGIRPQVQGKIDEALNVLQRVPDDWEGNGENAESVSDVAD